MAPGFQLCCARLSINAPSGILGRCNALLSCRLIARSLYGGVVAPWLSQTECREPSGRSPTLRRHRLLRDFAHAEQIGRRQLSLAIK